MFRMKVCAAAITMISDRKVGAWYARFQDQRFPPVSNPADIRYAWNPSPGHEESARSRQPRPAFRRDVPLTGAQAAGEPRPIVADVIPPEPWATGAKRRSHSMNAMNPSIRASAGAMDSVADGEDCGRGEADR